MTEWQLERLAQGELDEARARQVLQQLGPEAQARLAGLEASNQEILGRLPPPLTRAPDWQCSPFGPVIGDSRV